MNHRPRDIIFNSNLLLHVLLKYSNAQIKVSGIFFFPFYKHLSSSCLRAKTRNLRIVPMTEKYFLQGEELKKKTQVISECQNIPHRTLLDVYSIIVMDVKFISNLPLKKLSHHTIGVYTVHVRHCALWLQTF